MYAKVLESNNNKTNGKIILYKHVCMSATVTQNSY